MFVNKWTDSNNDLYIKYFLIDSSLNDRKWATTDEANAKYARTAIGTPFTVMHNKDESLFGDYHAFLPGDAPVKDQIDFAYKYAIGQIVDVTKESGQYKAAGGPVANSDKPWFAIVKITDPTAKEELSKPDSKLVPQAVSPGIIHYDGPDNAISSYHIVHLAAVDKGAYGPRAIKWASCSGDAMSCVPTLKSASLESIHSDILEDAAAGLSIDDLIDPVKWSATIDDRTCGVCERLDGSIFNREDAQQHHPAHDHCRCNLQEELGQGELLGASYISPRARKQKRKSKKKAASYKERNHICPLEVLSSYVQKSGSSDINMSAVNPSTPAPQSFGTGTISTSYPSSNQSQGTPPTKPTIRIRRQKPLGLESEEENPEGQQPEGEGEGGKPEANESLQQQQQQQQPQASVASVTKELAQLKKQYESQANIWKQDSMRRELQDAIPKSLFTDQKGRFREKDWQREVDARLQQGLPIETIREIYQLKVQMLEVPEIAIKSKRASSYYNASPVPRGASSSSQYDEEDAEKRMKLSQLGRMIRGEY